MTVYFSDTFTDADNTALTSHTPDVGTGWTYVQNNPGEVESNQVTNPTFSASFPVAIDPPAAADYQVSADLIANGFTGNNAFLTVRDNGLQSEGYFGGWDDGTSEWQIGKWIGGGSTVLASNAAAPLLDLTTRHLVLSAVGTTINLEVDGTPLVTVTDATYAGIGQGSLQCNGVFQGQLSFDNFEIADVGGGGGGGTHSGLTGQGFITVSSPAGVEVDLVGIDASAGAGPGYPTPRYHVGSIGFSADATHYTRLAFLSQPSELFVSPFSGVTSISYSFAAGITATITELASF